ncbi:hypothetical protein [Azospirillum brasilense]|uniref:hypothetical protein n=1 Tax=Azospirillum brasilense TaxID=192 RepID=UPI001FFF3899|nr:hypothetical protein [Azospirillum brasilense]
MMPLPSLDRLFTRRYRHHMFGPVPERSAARLRAACRQLSEQELEMQALLGLPVRPSLILADEELAILIDDAGRRAVEEEG